MTTPETARPAASPKANVWSYPEGPAWIAPVMARVGQLELDLDRCRSTEEVQRLASELKKLRTATCQLASTYDSVRWFRLLRKYRVRTRVNNIERMLRVLEVHLLLVLPASAVVARVPGLRAELRRHIRVEDPRYALFNGMLDKVAKEGDRPKEGNGSRSDPANQPEVATS